MQLDDVYELQRRVRKKVTVAGYLRGARNRIRDAFGHRQPSETLEIALGVGIVWKGGDPSGYRLAVRVRSSMPLHQELAEQIRLWVPTADILFTEPVRIIAGCDGRAAKGPTTLSIGASIGHVEAPGGTLGFFAKRRSDNVIGVVSNNHVIALQDKGLKDSQVRFPSSCDPDGAVVALLDDTFPKLHTPIGVNKCVDCAFAPLIDQAAGDRSSLMSGGKLVNDPVKPEALGTLSKVFKIGRTTGRTMGRVKAFKLDPIIVRSYQDGPVPFTNQIEIETIPDVIQVQTFADRGDSGSLVFDSDNRPVGLLFAETSRLHYANPIEKVLELLKVDLVVA